MSYLDEQLDTLALEAAEAAVGRASHCGCGCARCASGFDEAARRRRPRAARRQTSPRAVGPQLPGWRGWSPPVSLRDIDAARAAARRGQPVPAHIRPFLARGPQVYRITRAGIDRNRPLSIGMTKAAKSIGQRVREHHRLAGGDPRVQQAIRNLPAGQVLVQAAQLTRQGQHPRRARNYEGWLQDRERPLLYDPNSTTFEHGSPIRYA